MSIPTAVFLDTSILDGQQYNFQSTALATFVPVCVKRGVKLLLPDPTEREIRRHIGDRSRDALKALERARRSAPFLAKWPPLQRTLSTARNEEFLVHQIALEGWSDFVKQFLVVRLGYDGLDVKKIMGWYDRIEAPFREGEKRKEFPDAFVVAMLEEYAVKEKIYVAVVSADNDFKLACERFSCLLHFESLPRLTELLLSDDARLESLKAAIDLKIDVLYDAVNEELGSFSLYHSDESFKITSTELEADLVEPSVVAIGDNECTISFHVNVRAGVRLEWLEWGEDGPEANETRVKDRVEVTGTAKLVFADDTFSVRLLSFDDYEAGISETP